MPSIHHTVAAPPWLQAGGGGGKGGPSLKSCPPSTVWEEDSTFWGKGQEVKDWTQHSFGVMEVGEITVKEFTTF